MLCRHHGWDVVRACEVQQVTHPAQLGGFQTRHTTHREIVRLEWDMTNIITSLVSILVGKLIHRPRN